MSQQQIEAQQRSKTLIQTQVTEASKSTMLEDNSVQLSMFQNFLSTDTSMRDMSVSFFERAHPAVPASLEVKKEEGYKARKAREKETARFKKRDPEGYERMEREKAEAAEAAEAQRRAAEEKIQAEKTLQKNLVDGRNSEDAEARAENFKKKHPQYDWLGINWGGSDEATQLSACERMERVRALIAANDEEISAIPALKTVMGHLTRRLALLGRALALNCQEKDALGKIASVPGQISEDMLLRKKEEQALVTMTIQREMALIESLAAKYANGEQATEDERKYLSRSGMRGIIRRQDDAAPKAFTKREDADKYHRPRTTRQWRNMSASEKLAAYDYTMNSHPLNMPLRGFQNTWTNYVGPGNATMSPEVQQKVDDLRAVIDRSTMPEDVMLVRGSSIGGLAGLLGIPANKITPATVSKIDAVYSGQIIKDPAFFSTGVADDAGFSGDVQYKILAQKGTKGLYAEPFSHYGGYVSDMTEKNQLAGDTDGAKYIWDGKAVPKEVLPEAEIILQAGTRFAVEKIEYDATTRKYVVSLKTLVAGGSV